MATQASPGKANPVLLFLSAYLILRLLWRIFTPGGSWAMPPWQIIEIAIDVVLVLCLILMRPLAMAPIAPDDPRRSWMTPLIWGGIAAGIAALGIRFTGDVGWWTGHLN